MTQKRITGVGLGLRWEFIDELLDARPTAIDFVEIAPENYMGRGGYYRDALARAVSAYPILTHGLTMSLGGTDPLDADYLASLRSMLGEVSAPWHSDHLCFGSSNGRILHDLLPIRFTREAVARVADRIRHAQDAIALPLAIENISFYMHPGKREMNEAEFIAQVCEKADCGLMLDVNNAYVNSQNFAFDIDEWMRTVPLHRVVQIHVAGHDRIDDNGESVIIDTHGADVCDPVLTLLEKTLRDLRALGKDVPILLERDTAIPELPLLLAEVEKLRAIRDRVMNASEMRAAI
jgi:uncharacterized protein (UPF0276 family)